MSNLEESNTSEDLFRQTSCSVKFKDKVSKGNCHFNETGYSKGFFTKNEDSDWIDEKMLQMNMPNENLKQNIRPNSSSSNQSKRKKKQPLRQATEQTDDLENSKVVLSKTTQDKKRKSSVKIIKNTILNSSQQAYLQLLKTSLPEKSYFQCQILRINFLTQSKFNLIYKNQEVLTNCKSEGLHFGTQIDVRCIALQNKLAILKSNVMRSTFNLYQNFSQFNAFFQTMTVCYKEQPLFSSNPRKIQIYLLKDTKNITNIPENTKINLKQRYQQGQTTTIIKLTSREALKSQNNRCYLNLDRSSIASVKNTILEDQSGKQVINFIKVDQNKFKLRVKAPLSVLSGYGFAVTSLIFKFACQ